MKGEKGFWLISLIFLIAILGIITAMAIPYGAQYYETKRLEAEGIVMDRLAKAVSGSFFQTDSTLNISYMAGASYMPASSVLTVPTSTFDALGSVTLADGAWQAKVARQMGLPFVVNQVVTPGGGEIADSIAFNKVGRERWFLIGPTADATHPTLQRYLIISLMVSPDAANDMGLVWPPNDGTQEYFDEIDGNNWGSVNTEPPAGWANRLTAAQFAAWQTVSRGRTYAGRVVVRRVQQGKFLIGITNTHQLDYGWLDIGGVSNALVSAPLSGGVTTNPLVLEGRQVILRRGETQPGVSSAPYFVVAPVTHFIQ